jgi:hypothetical protein
MAETENNSYGIERGWPLFCTALTPTVLPNSFGVPPDLSFPYLLQAQGLPRYGFCALEMP